MKRTVFVRFELSKHLGVVAPLARFWLDRNHDGHLVDDEEIPLQAEGLVFSGSCEVEAAAQDGTAFRLSYLASTGARWTLEVTSPDEGQEGPGGPVLYKATGIVGAPKDWLMGGLSWKEPA